ncbi:MAG: hydroxyacid dehydrogenase [Phycisphaerae bacterium]
MTSPATGEKLRGAFCLGQREFDWIYGTDERREIAELLFMPNHVYTREYLRDNPGALADIDVVFSGWGGPRMDENFLSLAPALKLVLYGAGSLSEVATYPAWARGVRFCSAAYANSIPVAEYSLAAILLGLKHVWHYAVAVKSQKSWMDREPTPGGYRSVVGLASLGLIARILIEKLKSFDLKIIAYDPFVSQEEARHLGVELVDLPGLFIRSDAISIHTPLLRETHGIITGELVSSMRHGATLINTARGALINEPEMLDVAARRPDLQFILDVTDPEPPIPSSRIFDLPNVITTPHIAGSVDRECQRMGRLMVDELRRYLAGEPLQHEVTAEEAQHTIHRPVRV